VGWCEKRILWFNKKYFVSRKVRETGGDVFRYRAASSVPADELGLGDRLVGAPEELPAAEADDAAVVVGVVVACKRAERGFEAVLKSTKKSDLNYSVILNFKNDLFRT
jgi:hypothetical protein